MSQPDITSPPVTKIVKGARVAMWLNEGTDADVAKAKVYAKAQGLKVFAYPQWEKDAFAAAKRDVLLEPRRENGRKAR